MTALDLIGFLSQLLYVVVFLRVLVDVVQQRRRASVDAALFFGILAVVVVIAQAFRVLGLTFSPQATTALVVVILALPYAMLRLADDYRGVGRWLKTAALAGLAFAILAVVIVPLPYPPAVGAALSAYFVLVIGYCAYAFGREATGPAGIARQRMRAVTTGTALFTLGIALSGGRAFVPAALGDAVAAASSAIQLGAGLAFFVGFAPPTALVRFWREGLLRDFIQTVARLGDVSDTRQVVRRLESAASIVMGAGSVSVALYDASTGLLRTTAADGTVTETDPATSMLGVALREGRSVMSDDARDEVPRAKPSAKNTGHALLAAPITQAGRPVGVLTVRGARASLFARDDLALLEILADQTAIALENARLFAEVRRLHEEERRRGQEATARLAAIVESSVDAVIGSTPAGIVTDWNPAAERLFGYAAEEIIGKPDSLLVPPELMGEASEHRRRIVAGEQVHPMETIRVRKDGTHVSVSSSDAVIRDVQGDPVGLAAFVRDETDRVEEQRRRADLEAKLQQSERLDSLGRLAGGVAHDLNNILAIVANYADFVAERLPSADPVQQDVEQIKRAAERGTTFTRQLLTFARRSAVAPVELRLDRLLTDLRSMLGRALPESIAFDLRVSPDVWSVVADRGQVEQVLLNLVVNAGDAMPEGGRLIVEATNVEYDDETALQHQDLRAGRYVVLTVTDTGHGMPKAVLDRAFEPFFTTKPAGQGTGLGLATVHGVVQQAGGRVSVYSEVGRGTSVRVVLPAIVPSGAETTTPLEPVRPAREGAVILLVEDEDAVREAARRILSASGYEVLEAADGRAGLERSAAREGRIDLLLTDMVMPGLSGRELSRRLRDARPEMAVVYMSGYAEELIVRDEKLDGPMLTKPFTRRPLLEIVSAALDAALDGAPP